MLTNRKRGAVFFLTAGLLACGTLPPKSQPGPPAKGEPASKTKTKIDVAPVPAALLQLRGGELLLDGEVYGDQEAHEELEQLGEGAEPDASTALMTTLAARAKGANRHGGRAVPVTICFDPDVPFKKVWGAIFAVLMVDFAPVTLALERQGASRSCRPLPLFRGGTPKGGHPWLLVIGTALETLLVIKGRQIKGPTEGRLKWITKQLKAHPRSSPVQLVTDYLSSSEVAAMAHHFSHLGYRQIFLGSSPAMLFPDFDPTPPGSRNSSGPGHQIGEGEGLDSLGIPPTEGRGETLGLGRQKTSGGTMGTPLQADLKKRRSSRGRVKLDKPSVRGALTVNIVARNIARHKGQIVACYQRKLKTRPRIKGRIALVFIIDPRGRITDVVIGLDTVGDDEMAACIKAGYARWRFPKPTDKKPVKVRQQLLFSIR